MTRGQQWNAHSKLQLMPSVKSGETVRERPSSSMSHPWYKGWLQSLTRNTDDGGPVLVGGGLKVGTSCLSDANSRSDRAVITHAVISWNRATATPGHARSPLEGRGAEGRVGVMLIWNHMYSFTQWSPFKSSSNTRSGLQQEKDEASFAQGDKNVQSKQILTDLQIQFSYFNISHAPVIKFTPQLTVWLLFLYL